ncbi:MAG: amidohydrolase family protein [Gammaproteobacteria bacterium]|nr:amidohydrolase family protein [Gammaproteobacteria bacterium]
MVTGTKAVLTAILPLVVGACSQAPDEFRKLSSKPVVESFDAVVANGRVMDPASGLDALRHIGIRAGRIAAISETALTGSVVVDADGQVVAPGFVDLHSHGWTPLSQRYQLLDGVTTALELESGAYPAASHGIHPPIAIAERSLINYGASTGHAWLRSRLLEADQAVTGMDQLMADSLNGTGTGGLSMGRPAFHSPLPAAQLPVMQEMLRQDLASGGLGIGMLLDYMSESVDAAELRAVFEVAAQADAPVIVHIRRGVAGDPFGLDEVIGLARETGAAVHVCHLQASAMGAIKVFLGKIRAAQQAGLRITTESFPYNAGSTAISAAVFSRNWREVFAIDYGDVEWAATGERLTERTWHEYRKQQPGGTVIHHYNKERWTRIATEAADVIVASDALPAVSEAQLVAPWSIGTFARVLGHYARDEGTLDLMTALAKMTIMPARLLEHLSDDLARKGRIAVGADADLTIFDPATIEDHATYRQPFQPSAGITHVLVNGIPVVRDGAVVPNRFPGRRLLGRLSDS